MCATKLEFHTIAVLQMITCPLLTMYVCIQCVCVCVFSVCVCVCVCARARVRVYTCNGLLVLPHSPASPKWPARCSRYKYPSNAIVATSQSVWIHGCMNINNCDSNLTIDKLFEEKLHSLLVKPLRITLFWRHLVLDGPSPSRLWRKKRNGEVSTGIITRRLSLALVST